MKISIMVDSKILNHYGSFIIDYEPFFPPDQRFKLMVSLPEINCVICDTFFVSAELAREHFFTFYGKRALIAESSIFEKVIPDDVVWSDFFSDESDLTQDITPFLESRRIELLFKLSDEVTKEKTDSSKGINEYE